MQGFTAFLWFDCVLDEQVDTQHNMCVHRTRKGSVLSFSVPNVNLMCGTEAESRHMTSMDPYVMMDRQVASFV